MELLIDFPGGSRVDAHFGGFTVASDQPPAASAPTPVRIIPVVHWDVRGDLRAGLLPPERAAGR